MNFCEIPDKFSINSDSVNETNVTDYLIGLMWKCGNIDPFNKEEKKLQLNILSKEKRKFSKIFPEIIKKFNRRRGRDNYTMLNNFNNSSDFSEKHLHDHPDYYYHYILQDISDSFLYVSLCFFISFNTTFCLFKIFSIIDELYSSCMNNFGTSLP